jgi:hypothetical protein
VIENLKRFYVNQLLDADKQAAINVFLGVADDRVITGKRIKCAGYDGWFDSRHLARPLYDTGDCLRGMCEFVAGGGDGNEGGNGGGGVGGGGSRGTTAEFWVEYYRPLLFTSLGKHFAWGMNSTLKLPGYVPRRRLFSTCSTDEPHYRKTAKDIDQSPFQPKETTASAQPRCVLRVSFAPALADGAAVFSR